MLTVMALLQLTVPRIKVMRHRNIRLSILFKAIIEDHTKVRKYF